MRFLYDYNVIKMKLYNEMGREILLVALCMHTLLVFSLLQIRHGAATALREVIKHHGDTAGISAYTPEPNVRYRQCIPHSKPYIECYKCETQ